MGGPGLDCETWVFHLGPLCEGNPGLTIETWATHLRLVRFIFLGGVQGHRHFGLSEDRGRWRYCEAVGVEGMQSFLARSTVVLLR